MRGEWQRIVLPIGASSSTASTTWGSHWQAERAAAILETFGSTRTDRTIADVIELHNAQLFAASGLFPAAYSDEQQATARARVPAVRGAVGRFFNALNEDNLAAEVGEVEYQYHTDLLELFARFKVYDRCSPATVLQVLGHLGVGQPGVIVDGDVHVVPAVAAAADLLAAAVDPPAAAVGDFGRAS
jgi:hypothetical protein